MWYIYTLIFQSQAKYSTLQLKYHMYHVSCYCIYLLLCDQYKIHSPLITIMVLQNMNVNTLPNLMRYIIFCCSTTFVRSNKLHIQVTPNSKLYTDNTGRFPIHARSGNQYIMITYHCNANLILAGPFSSRKDTHRLLAYENIMQCLANNKLIVDLKILDNEASAEYKRAIKTKWNASYQLVLCNTLRSNAAERAIRTFKAHFFLHPCHCCSEFT